MLRCGPASWQGALRVLSNISCGFQQSLYLSYELHILQLVIEIVLYYHFVLDK
jgi:hypothetical protein